METKHPTSIPIFEHRSVAPDGRARQPGQRLPIDSRGDFIGSFRSGSYTKVNQNPSDIMITPCCKELTRCCPLNLLGPLLLQLSFQLTDLRLPFREYFLDTGEGVRL